MYFRVSFIGLLLLINSVLAAQIAAGPMLGYAEMTETLIWIQTEQEGELRLEYWPENDSEKISVVHSASVASNEFVNKFTLSNLEPGTQYAYQIAFNNKLIVFDYPLVFKTLDLWQHRTDAPDFTFATGSCNYINEEKFDRPGKAFGAASDIFNVIADQQPNMMLWLGDNTYLREPDWNTWKGIVHRYNHTRAHPKMQRLLANCNHYAIWDDHDFGPNDGNGSFIHKNLTLEAFKLYWANPSYGLPNLPSIISQFRYSDAEFFLLDNRYYRTASDLKSVPIQILGKEQIDWLIQALKYSDATFKFVAIGGQFLNTAGVYENHANYELERNTLIKRLKEEQIMNVVFLTGDRHHSELSKLEDGVFVLYDLTVSPLTARAFFNEEDNQLRVDGTLFNEQSFALVSVQGSKDNRILKIRLLDQTGKLIWTQEIIPMQ
jgi:alkaline phosphatase D